MVTGKTYPSAALTIKKFRTPVISVALEQIYTAIRILHPEADVHIALDETLAAGFNGWMTLPLPAGVICCERYGLEWGEEQVQLEWAIDALANIAAALHSVSPTPTPFEYSHFWVKRQALYLHRVNTDGVNPRTYHLSIYAVMPTSADWDKWWTKIEAFAKGVLE